MSDSQIKYISRSVSIDVDSIHIDSDFNTRKTLMNTEDLASSILSLGQTTPVGVVQTDSGYNLVWGFRRLAAIRSLVEAGHDMTVVADVLDSQDANKLVLLNVQENVSREQLTLSEEFLACKKLSAFMTKEEIADALGVTKTWITTRMKLGDLSPVLLEAVDEGLSTRAAQAINLLPEELHEEYSARAVGQSVSTVSDIVQARLDEINGIDPNPAEDDADVELLDDGDDDLEPLDEDEISQDTDVESDTSSPLQELLESLANGANLSEDDQERFTLLIHSIRWSKVADQQHIVDALQLALSIEIDESDLDDSDLDDDDENVDDDNADVDDIELLDDED